MSYILDALKKSERERPPGPVPDLFTVHGPQPSLPRRPTRAIVAAVLFLVVLAISLWAWIGTGRREEGAAQPPTAAAPQPGAAASGAPERFRLVAAPATTAPVRTPAVATARARTVDEHSHATTLPALKTRGSTTSPMVQSSAPPVISSGNPPAVPAAPPGTTTPAPTAVPEAPRVPSPSSAVSAPAAPPATSAGGAGVSAPGHAGEMSPPSIPAVTTVISPEPLPAVSTSVVEPPADGRVLNLDELPAPVRAELPKLLVSGHVWSEEPALRLLSVDDRLLHEGDEAAPGVSLQEITPSGAVFIYKGWHFRVAGVRP